MPLSRLLLLCLLPQVCLRLPRRYVSVILRAQTPSAMDMIFAYAGNQVSNSIFVERS